MTSPRRSSLYGAASLNSFGATYGFENPYTGEALKFTSPFDPVKEGGYTDDLRFATRFGLSQYARSANDLANALQNPALQLKEVNQKVGEIAGRLNGMYKAYVGQLRQLYLPEEEVFARADAYIRPLMASEIELLRLAYPYAVGNAAGGQYSPLAGLAQGRGLSEQQGYEARKQFDNWRQLKKAFKARKKARKGGK